MNTNIWILASQLRMPATPLLNTLTTFLFLFEVQKTVNLTIENITKSVSINYREMKSASFAFQRNTTIKFDILWNNSAIVIMSISNGNEKPMEYWMCTGGKDMKWTKAYTCFSKLAWCQKNPSVQWLWTSYFASHIRCRSFTGKSFQNREQTIQTPFTSLADAGVKSKRFEMFIR